MFGTTRKRDRLRAIGEDVAALGDARAARDRIHATADDVLFKIDAGMCGDGGRAPRVARGVAS